MKRVPLVRASALIPFVTFLRQTGARAERLLARARLPAAVLDQPEALIPVHQGCQFLDEAARSEGIEHLGLVVGARTPIDALGSFGRLIAGSRTLHEALRTAVRLHPSYSTGGRLWIVPDGNRIWIRHGQDRRIERGREQAEQFTLMLALHLIRLATEQDWRPAEIQLHAGAAPGLESIDLLAGARVSFGHASMGVAIPRSLLSCPLAGFRRADASREELDQLLSTGPALDLPGSVRQAARTLLLDGYPGVQLTAGAIGMSVRSLQRRLSESGFSYSRLVEQERFRTSVRLLADPGVKVTEIAIELGYADLANFTHAFHRWTGVSPRQFRRQEPASRREPPAQLREAAAEARRRT